MIKAFPSMTAFFYICEYLGVSQQEFFEEGNHNPEQLNLLVSDLKRLDEKDLSHIAESVEEMIGRK